MKHATVRLLIISVRLAKNLQSLSDPNICITVCFGFEYAHIYGQGCDPPGRILGLLAAARALVIRLKASICLSLLAGHLNNDTELLGWVVSRQLEKSYLESVPSSVVGQLLTYKNDLRTAGVPQKRTFPDLKPADRNHPSGKIAFL